MKKHDLQIDGQINLFDLLESVENTPSDISSDLRTSQDEKEYKYDNPILNHLLEDLGKIFTIKKVEYEIWEHVPKLGKRLWFELADLPEDWNLEPYIEKYKKYDLEISITEHSIQEDVLNFKVNELWGSTLWKTKNHKERTDWKEDKAAEQEEKITLPLSHHYCYVIGSNCACMTEKGCLYPYKCGLMKESVESVNKARTCEYSKHSCNKENLWEIAESLDEECPMTCCRNCDNTQCGARCNGAEQKKQTPRKSKLSILERHPRTIEVFKQIASESKEIKKQIIDEYKIHPNLDILGKKFESLAKVETRSTDYGVVTISPRFGFEYKFDYEWEGVYVEELSWREYARRVIELIEEDIYLEFPKDVETDEEQKSHPETVFLFSEHWLPISINPKDITQANITKLDKLRILGTYRIDNKERWSSCEAWFDGNKVNPLDVPFDIPTPNWKYWRLEHKVYKVDIVGICDDARCPKCGYEFLYPSETDLERCPECKTYVDWTPWHIKNDKETEDEKVNS
jgi:hypothetical protein